MVCHGVATEEIAAAVGEPEGARLRYLRFDDGIRSPAGPFNHGIQQATAEYVSIMGSDDFVEPGAIRAWTGYVRAVRPDVALIKLRHQHGDVLLNPLTRFRRTRDLDPVRDRLFYRTAPLGLIRREVLLSSGAALAEGLRTGDDIAMSAQLWTSGARIDLMRELPSYVIGADASDRVTLATMPADEQLAALTDLLNGQWWHSLSTAQATSLGVKLLRIHVLDALLARPDTADWNRVGVSAVSEIVRRVEARAPRALVPLARADRRLLDVAKDAPSAEDLVTAIAARGAASRWDVVLPAQITAMLDRESVPVRYLHYWLDRWRRR